jgi:hypothetical protein
MRERLALVIVVVLSVSVMPAAAGNYRWMAPDGSVSYSDQPPPASVGVAPPANVPVVEPATAPAPGAPSPPANTERVTSGRPVSVEEILDLSGVTRQLGALSASLVSEFKAPPSFSPGERAAIARVAESHFHADRLLRTIVDDLRRGQDQRSLDAVAAWLRSPPGRKITAAEIAASVAPQAERRAGVSRSSAARAALIEQLDWLAGITDSQLETIVAITRATAASIADVLPPEQRKSPVEIDRDLQRKRAQLRPQVEQATAQFMLYQYRTLEDVELERFAAFLASAPGRWYSRAMSRALTQAIGAAATDTARAMIGVVPAARWRELAMAPPPPAR